MSGANTLESLELPDVPHGWAWAKLSELGKLDRGRSRHRPRNAKHLYGGPYPFVQTGDIREAVTFIHNFTQTYSEAGLEQSHLWPAGTLCITIAANIAETAILGLDACFPDSVVGFLPDDDHVSARYVEYYMRTLQQTLERIAPATAQKNLNLATLREVPIAIPGRKTQQDIVDKLDELFSDLDAGVAALKRARANLRRYRASVLKSAVEGRLTAAWRSANPGVEPATELLARILRERRQRWEQQQLATYESKGKKPPKNWQSKYKEPAAPDTANLPQLPNGWCWATVEQLGTINEQAVLTGPFGSSLGRNDFVEQGVGVLTIGCLTSGGLIWDKANYVTPEKADELSRYRLETGDLLFSRSASVGRVGIVTPEFAGCIVNYHLMRLRLASEVIDPRFFMTWVRGSSVVVSYLKEVNHGATRDGINTKSLLGMPVALPPILEQVEIGSQIDVQSSIIHVTDSAITTNEIRSNKLRQCILKCAFEGRLLEPASSVTRLVESSCL